MKYANIKHSGVQSLSLAGLHNAEFESLSGEFSVVFTEFILNLLLKGNLVIEFINHAKQVIWQLLRISFCSCYFLKTNPLQEHHAASFGINQPKANLYIHKFVPLLRQTLKRLGELPSPKVQHIRASSAKH